MGVPSGHIIKSCPATDIPTPDAGKAFLFFDSSDGDALKYRTDDGTLHTFEPAPLDATLLALEAQNWAANAVPVGTGADTMAQLSFAANTFLARSSSGNVSAKTITDYGLSLVDDANAASARTTLGLGSAATSNTGDFDPAGAAAAAQAASQPLDSDLTAIAALTTTSYGRSVLTQADATALRLLAGAVIGANVQAWSTNLDNLSGFTTDTDGTFAANSDTRLATQKAVKTYADSLVVGLLDDRGNYDASGNTFPASGGSGAAGAILKGDLWKISVVGTLGGTAVNVGDWVRALVDTPGQTAGNWAVAEGNIGYVPLNAASNLSDLTNAATARGNLGLAIGTNVQAWDADLDALAGLTTAADKVPYFTGSHTAALADLTSFARSLLDDADAATMRGTLGITATGADTAYAFRANNLSDLASAATARTNLGGTTVGQAFFTLTNPSSITYPRINADNTVTALSLALLKSDLGLAGSNSGDVTLAGENYLSIASQVITANAVNLSGSHVTGLLPLAKGGTNANLAADNGGIFYSTASAAALLASTATAGQVLRSGSSGAPTWSTATYPAAASSAANYLRSDGTNWLSANLAAADLTGTIVNARLPAAISVTTLTASGDGNFGGLNVVTTSGSLTVDFVSNSGADIWLRRYSSDASTPGFTFYKGRGTRASPTAITTGDQLGQIIANGYDSNNAAATAATILFQSEGTIAAGAVPAKMLFKTANAAGTLTTGLTIDSAQLATFAGDVTVTGATTLAAASVTTLSTTGLHTATGGVTVSGSTLTLSGNFSAAAWTTNGIGLRVSAATYTDTTSSGTVALVGGHTIDRPTLAASSSVTFTNAATLYLVGAPIAGTNVTITAARALRIEAGGMTVVGGGSWSGGSISLNINSNSAVSIGTGTSNAGVNICGSSNTLSFFGVTAVARASAYTQTYSTATKTHSALTSATLTDNTAGTGNTTLEALTSGTIYGTDVAAIRNNFADLAKSNNAIIVDLTNLKGVVNSIIDDLQAYGLMQ